MFQTTNQLSSGLWKKGVLNPLNPSRQLKTHQELCLRYMTLGVQLCDKAWKQREHVGVSTNGGTPKMVYN